MVWDIRYRSGCEGKMSERGMGMLVGVGAGIVLGLILVYILLKVTKTDGKVRCRYDERQNEARGKGYKYGFFTFLLCDLAYGIAYGVELKLPFDTGAAMILIMVAAVSVYISYCIWNDAYFSLNENHRRLMIAFVLIAVINLGLGIASLRQGRGIRDGVLTFESANLFCGLLFVIVFLAMAAKRIREKIAEEK